MGFGDPPVKYIYFQNNTDLPIEISSWIDGSNTLHHFTVNAFQKLKIHSSVGEWHLNIPYDETEFKVWKDKNLGIDRVCPYIGKFRSEAGASGNYSWLNAMDVFECVYTVYKTNDDNGIIDSFVTPATFNKSCGTKCVQDFPEAAVMGLITFSQKL